MHIRHKMVDLLYDVFSAQLTPAPHLVNRF